jgi:hypothetical protein
MQVRKVVTGHDAKGRAVIARDEQIDGVPIPGLGELAFLWGANEPATYPNAGDNPAAPAPFPPVGGIRFVIATYSPESDVVAPEPLPGMHVEDGDEPGMHRTDSTDFGVVLSATWYSGSTMAWRCCCLPAMSWYRTELATVGAWLEACRPPWLLSSSEPTAVRLRPASCTIWRIIFALPAELAPGGGRPRPYPS